MSSSLYRAAKFLAVVALAPWPAAFAQAPAQAQSHSFDVPAQPASDAVRLFARQAGIQIIVAGRAAQGRSARKIRGTLDTRTALHRLLLGTGLFVRAFDGKIAILDAVAAAPVAEANEPIVVTGTRIARPEVRSAMPVSVVGMADAERFGRVSAYDALMRSPPVAPGIGLANAFGQTWDAGVSSISLRNLGTNRSLTLIDGMRRVSGSARSSAVDINMIPAAMIDRIEVITGGATAIYGADAVTGAINIITRRAIEGLNISATNGISQQGDARQYAVSVSTGRRFADGRGSVAIGGTYSKTASLIFTDRYKSYVNSVFNPRNTGADDGIPDRVTVPDFRQIYYAYDPSFFFNGQSYLVQNGVPRIADYEETLYPGEFSYGNGGDGRNLRDRDQLRGGLEALALIGRIDYAPSRAFEYSAHFDYGRTYYSGTASFPIPRDDSRTIWFNGAGGAVARLDNPLLPPAVRQFMLDNGLNSLNISRTYGNFPVMREKHDRQSFTIGQSLGGVLTGSLKWQAYQQYGRAADDVRTLNIPYASHWVAARDVVADPVTGQPICRDAAARAAGCLPLDIFSLAPPSDALKAYVLATRKERRVNTQHILGASIVGKLFSLSYGEVSVAVGAEHRRETLRTRDDPLARTELAYGGSGYTVHPDLDAGFDVAEVYGELVVPLLADLPFANSLTVEGAYRYSDYSTVGDTRTWKIGGTWSPVSGVMFRGVRSRSARTPNFGELYEQTITRQAGSITDPCEAGDYYQSAIRSANCRALGVVTPLGDFKIGPLISTSGNPDLKPETSDSLTLGLVLRPRFLREFEATIDYWDIDIRDVITQYGETTVMNLCVDLPTINNIYCKAVDRDPMDGHVTAIRTTQINAARLFARGIDIGARYQVPLGQGALHFDLNATYLIRQRVETMPGAPTGNVRYDGDWQNPRFRGTLTTRFSVGDLSVSLDTRLISAGRFDVNSASGEVYDRNAFPIFIYNDCYLNYKFHENFNIGIGMNNISDIYPPKLFKISKDGTIYDNIGRYAFIKIGVNI
jgi:iron complex outermembrane receptor protein